MKLFLSRDPIVSFMSPCNVYAEATKVIATLFRRRLSAEGAKPESNNRWKSELGHVCMWVGMYGIWNYLANQVT